MKPYKRQKIAMLALIGAMAIGTSGTAFAANYPISANDGGNKPAISKMQKGSVLKNKTTFHKKHLKKKQIKTPSATSTTTN